MLLMIKSLLSSTFFLLPVLLSLFFYGCAEKKVIAPTPKVKPEITATYLFEHRIISHSPSREKIVLTTLPFEIKTFNETYILNLVSQIPTGSQSDKNPQYYVSVQRQASNWQEYKYVYSEQTTNLILNSSYSGIRNGVFYTNYTIDLSYEQLLQLQNSDFYLTLSNAHKGRTLIELPKVYIQAFIMIINHPNDEKP